MQTVFARQYAIRLLLRKRIYPIQRFQGALPAITNPQFRQLSNDAKLRPILNQDTVRQRTRYGDHGRGLLPGQWPLGSWYGFSSRESWCANECGYIEVGIIPKFAGCIAGFNWFKERGQWAENTAEPSPGIIIFFDWDGKNGQDGESDHVGIVERVEAGRVYTIEGNFGDQVRQNSYPVGYYEIYGYGIPTY